jgi:hypothetical protein
MKSGRQRKRQPISLAEREFMVFDRETPPL